MFDSANASRVLKKFDNFKKIHGVPRYLKFALGSLPYRNSSGKLAQKIILRHFQQRQKIIGQLA